MEFGDFYKIVAVIVLIVVGILSMYIGPFKNVPSNPVEKVAEEIIKDETGLDINLDLVAPKKDVSDGQK